MQNRLFGDIDLGATAVLAWNGVLDEEHGPKNFGCPECRGLLTTNFSEMNNQPKAGSATPAQLEINPEFFAIAHVSRYVQRGAMRMIPKANTPVDVLAFLNPDGTQVTVMRNGNSLEQVVQIRSKKGAIVPVKLPARSTVTVRVQADL
jgi:glucosylceramidase